MEMPPIPLVFFLTRRAQGWKKAMAAMAGGVMASTIFLSGSRGGMAAFIVQMAVLAIVLMKQRRAHRSNIGLGLFVLMVIGLLIWLGGSELTTRVASINLEARNELSGGVRTAIDRDGLRMFVRKPVLGWGLGVFPDVYPRYRSFYTNFFINQAHNDYLQLLLEMGTLGFTTMIWFVVQLYRHGIAKIGNWSEDINGAIPRRPCWASLASWSTVLLISICKSQPTPRFSTCSALWPRLNSVSAGPFASMFEDRPRRQKSQRREIDGCAGQA
jgi:hypothetical protein